MKMNEGREPKPINSAISMGSVCDDAECIYELKVTDGTRSVERTEGTMTVSVPFHVPEGKDVIVWVMAGGDPVRTDSEYGEETRLITVERPLNDYDCAQANFEWSFMDSLELSGLFQRPRERLMHVSLGIWPSVSLHVELRRKRKSL